MKPVIGPQGPTGTAASCSAAWQIPRRKLTKGTHVQVQGQLRNREYQKDDGKQRATEIRVTALSKLDRPGRRGAVNPDDMTGNPEARS